MISLRRLCHASVKADEEPGIQYLPGYLWFFALAFWVHDMPTIAWKARAALALYAVDVVCFVVFVRVLEWV